MESLVGKRMGLPTGLVLAGLGFGMVAQMAYAAPRSGGPGDGSGGGSVRAGGHNSGGRVGSIHGGTQNSGARVGGLSVGNRGGGSTRPGVHTGSHGAGSLGGSLSGAGRSSGARGGSFLSGGHGGGSHGDLYTSAYRRPYYSGSNCRSYSYRPYSKGYSVGFAFGYSPSYSYAYPDAYPVVVREPVVVEPQPFVPGAVPAFVETRRRYHSHGDDAGTLDWVEGLLNGRPVRIYYDEYGAIEKQKWLD